MHYYRSYRISGGVALSKAKAFTLMDLIAVLFVLLIFLFFIIPMGAMFLRRFYPTAKRVMCSAQLARIGEAIAYYQNDFNDRNPALTTQGQAAASADWQYFGGGAYNSVDTPTANTRWYEPMWAENTQWPNDPCELRASWKKTPTVGGCLYLLVCYEDLVPRLFVCPAAPNDREMDFEIVREADTSGSIQNWADLRDFASMYHLSYGMHDPFKHPASAISPSDLAIMADKNPRFDNPDDRGQGTLNPTAGHQGLPTADKRSKSKNDCDGRDEPRKEGRGRGQNVLFAGLHVEFAKTPRVGIGQENIYTRWSNDGQTQADRSIGSWPEAVWENLSAGPADVFIGQ